MRPHRPISPVDVPAPRKAAREAFTLLEILLAVCIFAIVLVAINTVFFASLRLRRSVSEALDKSIPLNHALAVLRRDLQNAVGPSGVLAGNFRSDGPAGLLASGKSGGVTGLTTGTTGATGGQNGGLDFFTTTGIIRDELPWGDIQEVNYQLLPSDQDRNAGKELVRSVTRNLLTYATPTPEVQRLTGNIDQLNFEYYDGSQWRDTWDTTAGDTNLPVAVRVRIQLVPESTMTARQEPLEMMVLLNSAGVSSTISTNTPSEPE